MAGWRLWCRWVGAQQWVGPLASPLSVLIRDALSKGQIVLVARTLTEQEPSMAKEIVHAAVGEMHLERADG